jgi:Tfp pilus assembly protein FimT
MVFSISHCKINGLSLLEVLLTVSLISLLNITTIPVYQKILPNEESLFYHRFISKLQVAHTLAITQNDYISFTQYQNNLIIFYDVEHKGEIKNENQIIDKSPLPTTGTLHSRIYPRDEKFLQFLPNGYARGNGSFWYCKKDQKVVAWGYAINKAGRVRPLQKNELLLLAC